MADVVGAARAWLGTPWKHQGRDWAGLDCAGLIIVVAWTLNLPAIDVSGYRRDPNIFDFMAAFRAQMEEILPLEDYRPGDVVLFLKPGELCHSGILTEKLGLAHLIHAHAPIRMVAEEPLTGELWRARRAAFRYRGLMA